MKPLALLTLLALCALLSAQTELQTMLVFESPTDGTYNGYFIESVSGNGDLNGDGFNDIVIPGHPIGEDEDERRIYIYFGSAQPDSIPDIIFDVPTVDPGDMDSFGRVVAYDGDLNGDGYDDLVVAAPEYDGHYPNAGMVFIYWGGETLSEEPDVILNALDYGDDCWGLEFGYDLEISSDFNGDGYNDLVIGSPGPSLYWNGQVDVFFGGDSFDSDVDWHVQGEISEMYGMNLTAGDCNGDGYADLAIKYTDTQTQDEKVIHIYHGGDDFNTIIDYTSSTFDSGAYSKIILGSDLNQDGCDDIAIQHISNGYGFGFILGGIDMATLPTCFPDPVNNGNQRAFFTAELDDTPSLFISYPLDSLSVSIDYISEDSVEVSYTWHGGNYNQGWDETDYFIGDYNGDGHEDIIMSTRPDGGPWRFRILTTEYVSIDEEPMPPPSLSLSCYPNPTHGGANISFSLAQAGPVKAAVYNIRGQRVATLAAGQFLTAGEHTLQWDTATAPNGIYFIRITHASGSTTSKFVLLK